MRTRVRVALVGSIPFDQFGTGHLGMLDLVAVPFGQFVSLSCRHLALFRVGRFHLVNAGPFHLVQFGISPFDHQGQTRPGPFTG